MASRSHQLNQTMRDKSISTFSVALITYWDISYDCRFYFQDYVLHTIFHCTVGVYTLLTEFEYHHHKRLNILTIHSSLTTLHQLVETIFIAMSNTLCQYIMYLLGQWWELHTIVSVSSPSQLAPPYLGGVQVLVLVWVPLPQDLLQSVHTLHSVHSPSTITRRQII